jgi:hypothetical protein
LGGMGSPENISRRPSALQAELRSRRSSPTTTPTFNDSPASAIFRSRARAQARGLTPPALAMTLVPRAASVARCAPIRLTKSAA